MMKALAFVCVLATVGISATASRCKLYYGQAQGGTALWVGYLSKQQCINTCINRQRTDDSINGVTVKATAHEAHGAHYHFGCWCETGVTHLSHSHEYLTCILKPEVKYRCNGKNNFCCTFFNKCDLGDGDCDHDFQCKGDLVCGNNNCAWGDGDDCCVKKEDERCNGKDNFCCTALSKCGYGDGDCDFDWDCAAGLVCGNNNCAWGGGDDCCTRSQDIVNDVTAAESPKVDFIE